MQNDLLNLGRGGRINVIDPVDGGRPQASKGQLTA